ncbi:MAG: hypothetical protein ABI564_12100 [Ideonella sp.]
MELHLSTERVDIGRAIGHDFYCRSRSAAREAWPAPVHEGFVAARAGHTTRPLPDRYERKWLQLRLGAFERGRVINDEVTPTLLRLIDVEQCPVTRQPLTHGELKDSDWSVDRLNNDGAYAANNLAVMSTGANRAKGMLSYEAVYERSQRTSPIDGLAPVEWLRLAALMLGPCFADRPADAPIIPLAAPIPNRSLRPIVQQVQHVFTLGACKQAGKNQLLKRFKAASPTSVSSLRLGMLCEAMHQAMKGLQERHDVWLNRGVMQAFEAWRASLDSAAWALAGEISRQILRSRVVPTSRIASWHLGNRGYQA